MPIVSVTLPEVDQAVVRPALTDIIHQLEDVVKIPRNTRIMFPGDIGVNQSAKSSIQEEQDRRAIYTTENYLYVEVDQVYAEDMISSTASHRKEHPPIFLDREIGFAIWPTYLTTEFNINFKFSTSSKTSAIRWRDDVYARITQMRDIILHDITYHYQLPNPVWRLLQVIHDYKKRLLGDDYDFNEYFRDHSTPRVVALADSVGKNYALAVTERQSRILGIFDFSPMPEKIEREDTGIWICSFGYRVRFEKPALAAMRYPVMVYNKLLPAEYITFPSEHKLDENKQDYRRSLSMDSLAMFETNQLSNNTSNIYVPYRIPDFDDMRVRIGPAGYASALSVLMEVDETDKRSLLNLTDLDPYGLDEDILQFIRDVEWPYINRPYESFLYMGLYKNYQHYASGALNINSNLDVVSVVDLDFKYPHHVMFSLITDLNYLKDSAIARLKKYPAIFMKIIGYINESLRDFPEAAALAKKSHITALDFLPIFKRMPFINTADPSNFAPIYQTPSSGIASYNGDIKNIKQRNATNNTYKGPVIESDMFKNFRGPMWENIRANQVGFNRVQLNGIVANRK